MARQAVECFLAQSYANKELIILDDLEDRSFVAGSSCFEFTAVPILYYLSATRSIPEKRNAANALAFGDVILTVDSDDWSDPARMADQVRLLEQSGKSCVGYHSMLFAHSDGKVYKYIGAPDYAIGTSLTYTKQWWLDHPFPTEKNIGEDNAMVRSAQLAHQIVSVDAGALMVARIHPDCTSQKSLANFGGAAHSFIPMTVDDLPSGFPR